MTEAWYADYYARKGADRNDPLFNPGALLQVAAHDMALTRALAYCKTVPPARVLDVGCGSGYSLGVLMRLGFALSDLAGVEILADRVAGARRRFPGLDVREADAAAMPYSDGAFDVVMESTMFAQLTDETASAAVAREMHRVAAGPILCLDWRLSNPRDKTEGALGRARVRRLFPERRIAATFRGAVVPPIGRRLRSPALYFAAQRFLAAQVCYVLDRANDDEVRVGRRPGNGA